MTVSGDPLLLDLRHRMRSAHARLGALAEASGSRSNARRLRYKAQGVGLALSYVEESLTDDVLDLLERVQVFVCWEHRLVVKVLGSGATTRGTPGHRKAGCAECDKAIADAFACADEAGAA